MDDLISRQAAIDVINVHLNKTDVPVSYPGIIKALEEWLNDLPAVVTERTIDAPSGSAEDRKDTFVISLPPIQDPDLFVKEIIQEAIDAIKRCVDETHDMKTLLTLVKLCKLIAGDKFEAILEVNCDEEHTVGPE